MGSIRLFEKWSGIAVPLPHWAMLTAGIGGLFMAQYSAYRSIFKGRSSIVERLASLIDEGRALRHRYGKFEQSWDTERSDWQAKVREFLKKEMGPQALTKFSYDAGVPEFVAVSQFNSQSACPWLDREIQNLVDIMERIDAYL